jgi:hypothetical protein
MMVGDEVMAVEIVVESMAMMKMNKSLSLEWRERERKINLIQKPLFLIVTNDALIRENLHAFRKIFVLSFDGESCMRSPPSSQAARLAQSISWYFSRISFLRFLHEKDRKKILLKTTPVPTVFIQQLVQFRTKHQEN